MNIYRIVNAAHYTDATIPYPSTRRIPSNIPYLVDNLWEWLRPADYPSRRRCVCASPQPMLAHAANQAGAENPEYMLTQVLVSEKATIAQIPQKDAKEHPDVRNLPGVVLRFLGADWGSLKAVDRGALAVLFLPVIAADEVAQALAQASPDGALAASIKKASTFWADAKQLTLADAESAYLEGEIFFECVDGYRIVGVRYAHQNPATIHTT